jgi:hypothetical protein
MTATAEISWDDIATTSTPTNGAVFEVLWGDDAYLVRATDISGYPDDPETVYALQVVASSATYMEGRWIGSLLRERSGWSACTYHRARFVTTPEDMRRTYPTAWSKVLGSRQAAVAAALDAWHFAPDGRPLGR